MKRIPHALFLCFLLLALPSLAAAEPVIYVEPLTGTRVTLPDEFSSNTDTATASRDYGEAHIWVKDRMTDNSVQFDVSVYAIKARSMYDVLEQTLSSLDMDHRNYEMRELSANHAVFDEVTRSMGEKVYCRYWVWLLEDGSYVRAKLASGSEANKQRYEDAISFAFGTKGGKALMTEFPAPDAEREPLAGTWRNEKTGVVLEVYGKGVCNFLNGEGQTLAAGYHSAILRRVTFWGENGGSGSMWSDSPAEIGVSVDKGFDGPYVRVEGEKKAAPAETQRQPAPEKKAEGAYTLLADDADCSEAQGLVLEPDTPPRNLGGWRQDGGHVVKFVFSVEKEGSYRVAILSSRDQAGDAVVLVNAGEEENQRAEIPIKSTGGWGHYKTFASGSPLFLPAGEATLRVETGDPDQGDYLMNLRSITLTLEE